MSSSADAEVQLVLDHVGRTIGLDPAFWKASPGGYPQEIEAALVDAVFSANARYGKTPETGVRRVVGAWRRANAGRRLDSLLDLLNNAGNGKVLEDTLGSSQRVPGRGADRLTKAAAVLGVAGSLTAIGVVSAADARHKHRASPQDMRAAFVATVGIGDVTFEYFLMLLHVPGVKADRMVCRFVAKALGVPVVSPPKAKALVEGAARVVNVDPTDLDYAIWHYESGQ